MGKLAPISRCSSLACWPFLPDWPITLPDIETGQNTLSIRRLGSLSDLNFENLKCQGKEMWTKYDTYFYWFARQICKIEVTIERVGVQYLLIDTPLNINCRYNLVLTNTELRTAEFLFFKHFLLDYLIIRLDLLPFSWSDIKGPIKRNIKK